MELLLTALGSPDHPGQEFFLRSKAVYICADQPRSVKKLERAEDKERMMVRFHEDYASGAPVSVRDREGESAASAAE
jgi:hypothetical protein